jgi:hypothetical protein
VVLDIPEKLGETPINSIHFIARSLLVPWLDP